MALLYPSRDILDRLVRQPFPQKDLIPAMICVAEFSYRSPDNRARRGRVFSFGLADVHGLNCLAGSGRTAVSHCIGKAKATQCASGFCGSPSGECLILRTE